MISELSAVMITKHDDLINRKQVGRYTQLHKKGNFKRSKNKSSIN